MRLFGRWALSFLSLSFILYPAVFSLASEPGPLTITVKAVELQNDHGEWLVVIEPDKLVDFTKVDPGLSFFNNGRVPVGHYINFRVTFTEGVNNEISRELHGREALKEPFNIEKGSFVGVWFDYELSARRLKGLSITVDEYTRNYTEDELVKK